jgi:putative peptide zinc metalloprotease protein
MTAAETEPAPPLGADGILTLHRLAIRASDDDPDLAVVGRPALGEFVELPSLAADAIRLLDAGLAVAEVARRLQDEQNVELDVAELAEALIELGFVAAIDGRPLPDPADDVPGSHLPRLRPEHVRWMLGWPPVALWLATLTAATLTWWRQPDLLMAPSDFFWTGYVGLAVLVNTAMFSVSLSVHELLHLATARAYGAQSRISLSTRLHHLVIQTDVTAAWAAPRAARYRVYLAGLAWDSLLIGTSTLLVAYAGLPALADRLLAALSLVVLLSMLLQTRVYLRTDLYYVLMEWLRGRRLVEDGWAFVRHLARRLRRRSSQDPTADMSARERRGVRIYAVAMAGGVAVALISFVAYGLPILIEGVIRAVTNLIDGLHDGEPLRVLDSTAIILVEGGIQVVFLVTFHRRHRHWFRRGAARSGPDTPIN